ncbi:hypothetical protein Bca52824_091845 [Brassica carinata]|uniref:WRKY domain-containing protein n=1 Tax=Brassica carinata TaxID=52824 RepID=A0A8X7NTN4_BRACI|nr:hypothetical protein Bca52824_091845 [Brassica carinata]
MAASSLLTMDNSRTRQNMNGSANWSGRSSTASLEDLEIPPKFRSFAPSSISISPSLVSPSTCFSTSVFLDSPAFVASSAKVLASPTTYESNQKSINEEKKTNKKKNNNVNSFDFSFQTQSSGVSAPTTTTATNSSVFQSQVCSNFKYLFTFTETRQHNNTHHQSVSYNGREQRKGEDGYNWRKYGQKQCPTKKKVETSLEGQITEIVYKGSHNHPKPQSTRRSSSSSSSTFHSAVFDHHGDHSDSFVIQQDDNTTSGSLGDDELTVISRGEEEDCGSEPEAKRWKGESETNGTGNGNGSKTVREPRIVVQTTSDIDILDDGYRWRKKHNHDVPAARGSGYSTNRLAQDPSSAPIRPNAIAGHTSYTTSSLAPYTLQMLHNNNTSTGSFGSNNNNFVGGGFSRAKEEPNDESSSFFDSFLS